MAQPELIARLGIDEKDFIRGLNASEASLKGLQDDAKVTAAQIALLERDFAAGNGSVEMGKKHAALQQHLRTTQAEAIATAKQLKALEAVKPAAAVAAPLPDESARYEAHLRRVDEQERSRRAHEAISTSRLAMPEAAKARAAVTVANDIEEVVEKAAGVGISRVGRLELGHVARSVVGSVSAGVPASRALEMEAPRIISALGPAVMGAVGGLAGLTAILAPLAVAVAAAAAGFTLYNANERARKQRNTNDLVGNVFNRGGDTVEELDKELEDAQKQEDATRKLRHSKSNHLANLAGDGLQDSDVDDITRRKVGIRDRRDDAMERDAGFARRAFDGDEGVEQEKLKVELEEKIRGIRASMVKDGDRLVANAREQYQLAVDEIARRQESRKDEIAEETQLASIRRYGKNVESETARAHLEKAQADLKNGPAAGPEHDHLKAAVWDAQTAYQEAQRRERGEKSDLALRTQNAGLVGGAADVDFQKALNDRANIQGKLDDPAIKPDEAEKLKADLAEAKARVRDMERGNKAREFARRENDIEANAQPGNAGKLDTLSQKYALNREKAAYNQSGVNDPDVASQLKREGADLLRQKQEIRTEEEKALREATLHTTELQAQVNGQSSAVAQAKIRLQYEEKIAEALRNGESTLAGQLQKEMSLALVAQQIAHERMTPEQRAAEQHEHNEDARAAYRIQNRQQRHDDAVSADGTDASFRQRFHGNDPIPADIKAPAGPSTVGPLFSDSVLAPVFGQPAKPALPLLPDLRPQISASHANAGKGDTAGGGSPDVVAAVDKCTEAVKGISLKNK